LFLLMWTRDFQLILSKRQKVTHRIRRNKFILGCMYGELIVYPAPS